jgi:hypothetical protein
MKPDERVENFLLTGAQIIEVDDTAGCFEYVLERTRVKSAVSLIALRRFIDKGHKLRNNLSWCFLH